MLALLATPNHHAHSVNWSDVLAFAAVVIAFLALVVSVFESKTARQALRLSRQQEDRQAARLDIDLRDELEVRSASRRCRWVCVRILAVNPTDGDAAITRADLHIAYSTDSAPIVVVQVPHDALLGPPNITPVALPAPVAARGAIDGWLVFPIHDDLIGSGKIERFDVVVQDSRGLVEQVHPWAMREVDLDGP